MSERLTSLSAFNLDWTHLQSQGDVWQENGTDVNRRRFLDRVRELREFLPPLDRDILTLTLNQGLTQRQVEHVLGLSQQAVCRRIASATKRIEFLVTHPPLARQMPQLLSQCVPDAQQRDILARYARTGNLSVVARSLGRSQQWVHALYAHGLYTLMTGETVLSRYLGAWFVALAGHSRYLGSWFTAFSEHTHDAA